MSSNNRNAGEPARHFSLKDEDIVVRRVSRRSALALLGAAVSLGAASALLGGCAGTYEEGGGGYGGGYPQRHHDIKLGDGNDYTVYADGRDLDSDSRDTSDYGRERTADRSSSNDYD